MSFSVICTMDAHIWYCSWIGSRSLLNGNIWAPGLEFRGRGTCLACAKVRVQSLAPRMKPNEHKTKTPNQTKTTTTENNQPANLKTIPSSKTQKLQSKMDKVKVSLRQQAICAFLGYVCLSVVAVGHGRACQIP